eukprot:17019-Heterococcus_DN1.PRE.1
MHGVLQQLLVGSTAVCSVCTMCPEICFCKVAPLLSLLANAAVYVKHVASTCDEALRSCKQCQSCLELKYQRLCTRIRQSSELAKVDSLQTELPLSLPSHRTNSRQSRHPLSCEKTLLYRISHWNAMDVDDTSPSASIHELARLGNAAGVRTLIEQ